MSDDKGDDIPEPDAKPGVPAGEAEVASTTTETGDAAAGGNDQQAPEQNKLSDLMAGGRADAPKKPAVDLESEAIRAAELALAEGEKALHEARAQLASEPAAADATKPAPSKRRELALRLLLAGNVLAMVIVALLPTPTEPKQPDVTTEPEVVHQAPVQPIPPAQHDGPFERAMLAASRHEWAAAVEILERHLEQRQGMSPSERLSVLLSLTHYASRANDFKKSEMYRHQAQALEQSHSLPEDLIQSADAALASGDQESLRRLWARFLLQQRQIPSRLYQHVARAYLQLGDSYRQDADAAAAKVRAAELEAAAAKLRAEVRGNGEKR